MKAPNDEEKEVVKVNTGVKKVVTKKDKEQEELDSVSQTMEEHMKENVKNTKNAIDWKNLFTIVLLFAILAIGTFFVVRFIDKYNAELEEKKTSTTMSTFTTTTKTTPTVSYQLTTKTPTKATHTVFDKNR